MNVYWKFFLPTINTLVEVCGFAIVKKLIIMIKYFIIVYGSFSIIFNETVYCHNSDLENVHNNLFIHELFIQNYVSAFQNLPFGLYMLVSFTYYTYYTPLFTLYVGLLDSYISCSFHSLAVEKYPDNRMLGHREIVNGKVYCYCFLCPFSERSAVIIYFDFQLKLHPYFFFAGW